MGRFEIATSLLCLACAACGRSTSEVYCEEFAGCIEQLESQTVPDGIVDDCVDEVDRQLDQLPDDAREQAEAVIDDCSSQDDCGFVACICETIEFDASLCAAASGNQ